MTAGVTGLSILQGLASALDTMLPSAWTSPQPQLVGLWSQRMGQDPHSLRCSLSYPRYSRGHGSLFIRAWADVCKSMLLL
jgi:hypothetical protein